LRGYLGDLGGLRENDPFFNPNAIPQLYINPDIPAMESDLNDFFESNY